MKKSQEEMVRPSSERGKLVVWVIRGENELPEV